MGDPKLFRHHHPAVVGGTFWVAVALDGCRCGMVVLAVFGRWAHAEKSGRYSLGLGPWLVHREMGQEGRQILENWREEKGVAEPAASTLLVPLNPA